MLSEQEKREMLADGLSRRRREELSSAEKRKPRACPSLNEYIAFLMDVQKIKPFEHRRVITPTDKNVL